MISATAPGPQEGQEVVSAGDADVAELGAQEFLLTGRDEGVAAADQDRHRDGTPGFGGRAGQPRGPGDGPPRVLAQVAADLLGPGYLGRPQPPVVIQQHGGIIGEQQPGQAVQVRRLAAGAGLGRLGAGPGIDQPAAVTGAVSFPASSGHPVP